MTSTIRCRSRKLFNQLQEGGKESVRKLGVKIGASKSSIHRHLKAFFKRNRYPESEFWESEVGYAWLRLLIFGVLYDFGVKCNVGADRLSEFFKRIRVDTHAGVSPTAIRTQLNKIEELLPVFQEKYEKEQAGKPRNVIAAGDETFFNDSIILVLMDLSSGYLLLEEQAPDRTYSTWLEKAGKRLQELGITIKHAISDRARALIKLATDGFNCKSGADLFHIKYEVSKWLGSAFHRLVSKADKDLEESKAKLERLKVTKASEKIIKEQEELVANNKKIIEEVKEGREDYHKTMEEVSEIVHPYSMHDNTCQNSSQTEKLLEEKAKEIEKTANSHSIDDSTSVVKKFRNQLKDLASIVDVWWLLVLESLIELNDDKRNWLVEGLLPVVYWHYQMEKSQNTNYKERYKDAWQRALANWQQHSLTQTVGAEEIEHWYGWADWISGKFHRSSSAVEGRNGYLSQMYHNGRGLSVKRLKALTVIHNFDLKRADGTTAAERLFQTQFPDLFEWLIEKMGDLPLPRKGRERIIANPLNLQVVPS